MFDNKLVLQQLQSKHHLELYNQVDIRNHNGLMVTSSIVAKGLKLQSVSSMQHK